MSSAPPHPACSLPRRSSGRGDRSPSRSGVTRGCRVSTAAVTSCGGWLGRTRLRRAPMRPRIWLLPGGCRRCSLSAGRSGRTSILERCATLVSGWSAALSASGKACCTLTTTWRRRLAPRRHGSSVCLPASTSWPTPPALLPRPGRPGLHSRRHPPPSTLQRNDVRTVIWATGFKRNYRWLHVPVLDASGEIIHRGGVTPVSGTVRSRPSLPPALEPELHRCRGRRCHRIGGRTRTSPRRNVPRRGITRSAETCSPTNPTTRWWSVPAVPALPPRC